MSGELIVWDLEKGIEIRALSGFYSSVHVVSVTNEGGWGVTESEVWDLETGRVIERLELPDLLDDQTAVALGGGRIVSASRDNLLRVWDLRNQLRNLKLKKHLTPKGYYRRPDYVLGGHAATVRSLAISEDGRKAFSASDDKTLKAWDLDKGHCIATFEGEEPLDMLRVARSIVLVSEITGGLHFLSLEEHRASSPSPSLSNANPAENHRRKAG